MAHPSRVKSKIAGGIPHMPFQDFTATSLEHLLGELKKAKIPDARIEVSTSEDGRHYACSKPLVNVLVYTSQLGRRARIQRPHSPIPVLPRLQKRCTSLVELDRSVTGPSRVL